MGNLIYGYPKTLNYRYMKFHHNRPNGLSVITSHTNRVTFAFIILIWTQYCTRIHTLLNDPWAGVKVIIKVKGYFSDNSIFNQIIRVFHWSISGPKGLGASYRPQQVFLPFLAEPLLRAQGGPVHQDCGH